jgi:hypothetical protein
VKEFSSVGSIDDWGFSQRLRYFLLEELEGTLEMRRDNAAEKLVLRAGGDVWED